MTLRAAGSAQRRRAAAIDSWMGRLRGAFSRALRRVLRRAKAATDTALTDTAGTVPAEGFNATDAQEWWADAVQAEIPGMLGEAYTAGWADVTDRPDPGGDGPAPRVGDVTGTLLAKLAELYPQDLHAAVTQALADSPDPAAARARVAAVLAWDPARTYWQDEAENAALIRSHALDQYGPPGSPERTAGAASDPTVARMDRLIREARRQWRADRTVWQTHGERASDVTATAVFNAGVMAGYAAEGVTETQWRTRRDARVRRTHAQVDTQTAPVGQPYMVGGFPMLYPGDPSGPIWETAGCRCCALPVR